MRRRKITPEVIVNSSLTFLFGAIVGFASYSFVGVLSSRLAFAESADGTLPPFPKTLEEIREESTQNFYKIYKPTGPSNPNVSAFYREILRSDPASESVEEPSETPLPNPEVEEELEEKIDEEDKEISQVQEDVL
ncbi:hypothetical protein IJ380_01250 [Candidatus Saccharibacteria bacterium]|nr:hypothetical protein [Candidatus Saccharibacteria bacterium]